MLEQYRPLLQNTEQITACNLILDTIRDEVMRSNLVNPYSTTELNILKGLIKLRCDHPEFNYDVALDMVKEFLGIKERVLPKQTNTDDD